MSWNLQDLETRMRGVEVRCHRDTFPVVGGVWHPVELEVVVEVVKADHERRKALPGHHHVVGSVHFSGVGRQHVQEQKLAPGRKLA